jgi:hypothetical protein
VVNTSVQIVRFGPGSNVSLVAVDLPFRYVYFISTR